MADKTAAQLAKEKEAAEKKAAKEKEAAEKKAAAEGAKKEKAEAKAKADAEKKAAKEAAAAKKAADKALVEGHVICSECEHCFHDIKSKNPKPRCIEEDKPLDRTDKTPSWCPVANRPPISEDTGMPIPENCGGCEFMAHDDMACIKNGKKINSSTSRNSNCPLVKESKEASEE